MTSSPALRWILYTVGWIAMLLIFVVINDIFSQGIDKFNKAAKANRHRAEEEEAEQIEGGVRSLWQAQKQTILRLKSIRLLFFISWTTYPIYRWYYYSRR